MNGARLVRSSERASDDSASGSFTGTFLREFPRLRRVAAGMGFAASDVEDILQDVFVEVAERPGEYRDETSARHWLVRAVVNRCLQEYRRRRRFRRGADEILGRQRQRSARRHPMPGEDLRCAEEIELVRDALRELEAPLAAALVLRYFCSYNATEIGKILQLAPATVRGRLRTARLLLAERLERKGLGR
jgi:RNA polymerase sigma factor (sigma-70 family)